MGDEVEEVVPLGRGREVLLARPREPEALLDEAAFAARDEFLPYWADLWPSAVALAREVAPRALRGRRVLELGCGLALPAIAAAQSGARVTATDWAPEAIAALAANAARNGVVVEGLVLDWREPEVLLARAPWDVVLAADVLYEARNVAPLLALLPQLGGEVLLADPGRRTAEPFFAALAGIGAEARRRTIEHGRVTVHALRF